MEGEVGVDCGGGGGGRVGSCQAAATAAAAYTRQSTEVVLPARR